MTNPFRYGSVVPGTDFCGRQDLIKQLSSCIKAGQNVVLHGERRIGKTSLFVETVRKIKKHRLLRINFMEVKNVDTLCKRILHAILAMERSGSRFDRLMKNLAYLRPAIGINPITGEPSVSFDAMVQLPAEAIPGVLTLMKNLHHEKPLVVFLDEFQDIQRIEEDPKAVLALLRGTIQSGLTITVGPLSHQDFKHYLAKKFQTGSLRVDPIALDKVFKITDGVTGDIQQLCEALWSVSGVIGEERIAQALQLIFSREQTFYEVILARLTANYVRILKALAHVGGTQPTSSVFVRQAAAFNVSAIPQALKRMENQRIVFHDGRQWRFSNPFFGAWLLAQQEI